MADLQITDLTNGEINSENEWEGTGVFDKLIEAVNKNVQIQYDEGRLTGPEFGQVYLGSIQSVLSQSVQYLLQEKLVEAQIDGALKDIELKNKQLVEADVRMAQLERQTALVEAQVAEQLTDTGRKTNWSNKDLEVKNEQIISNKIEQSAILAKTFDEHGLKIDRGTYEFDDVPSTNVNLRHTQEVNKLKNEASLVSNNADIAESQKLNTKVDTAIKAADAKAKYGSAIEVDEATNTVTYTPANLVLDANLYSNYRPSTEFEAVMLKSHIEARIGDNTAKGYKADTYYKQYKSLQELFFSLGNAGIDPKDSDGVDSDSIYSRIVDGMEQALNNQQNVWGVANTGVFTYTYTDNTDTVSAVATTVGALATASSLPDFKVISYSDGNGIVL